MATAVAALYGNGVGILAKYPGLAFDIMGWDKQRLVEKQNPNSTTQMRTPSKPNDSLPEEENATTRTQTTTVSNRAR
jgi:hypothetical protein